VTPSCGVVFTSEGVRRAWEAVDREEHTPIHQISGGEEHDGRVVGERHQRGRERGRGAWAEGSDGFLWSHY